VSEELDDAAFCRIHRSAIVNLQRVKQLETSKDGGTDVVLEGGKRLPISRRYRKDLQTQMGLRAK